MRYDEHKILTKLLSGNFHQNSLFDTLKCMTSGFVEFSSTKVHFFDSNFKLHKIKKFERWYWWYGYGNWQLANVRCRFYGKRYCSLMNVRCRFDGLSFQFKILLYHLHHRSTNVSHRQWWHKHIPQKRQYLVIHLSQNVLTKKSRYHS